MGTNLEGERQFEAVALDMGQARDAFVGSLALNRTENSWQNIVRGVTVALLKRGFDIRPVRMAITGDVPMGAGLSSSASTAVAVTLAMSEFANLNLSPAQIAEIAREAENDFVGVPCGIMDQMASAASSPGAALLLDCRSLEHMPIAVSPELAIVIIDSGIRRELTTSAFAERRRQCELAAKHYGVTALRDLTRDQLEAGREGLDPVIFARARHVVSEIERVEPAAVALVQGDTGALSEVMHASHVSMRDDFEVSKEPLDRIVDTVSGVLGRGPKALGGVRLTGAGFGGCVVAVTAKEAAGAVINAIEAIYNGSAEVQRALRNSASSAVQKSCPDELEFANPTLGAFTHIKISLYVGHYGWHHDQSNQHRCDIQSSRGSYAAAYRALACYYGAGGGRTCAGPRPKPTAR